MQSIETKFVPCTNTKPNRIKVSAWCGSKTYSVPMDADNIEDAHSICAIRFIKEKGWLGEKGGKMVMGGNSKGAGYNFCIITDYSLIEVEGV